MPGTITPIGVGTALPYPKQVSAGPPLDPLAAPGDTNPPVVFEPPPGLTHGDTEVWIIATGGAAWGGCQVWLSLDGTTYAYAGTIYRGGRQGILTAALPSHADPDTADTLAVDLTETHGQLLSGTTADADAFVTLCYCDGELVSYQTATLTASQVAERYTFATPVSFPARLAGSYAAAGTAATAAASFAIQKNGAAVGTLAFAAGATAASFTMTTTTTYTAGDVLTITAP